MAQEDVFGALAVVVFVGMFVIFMLDALS